MTSGSSISTGVDTHSAAARPQNGNGEHVSPAVVVLTVGVYAATLAAVLLAARSAGWHAESGVRAGLIFALELVYLESSVRLARLRRYVSASSRVKMAAVWVVAAALSLPVAYTAVLVPVLLIYEGLRGVAGPGDRRYQVVFGACSMTLAGIAAGLVFRELRPDTVTRYGGSQAGAIAVAVLVFAVIDTVLNMVLRGATGQAADLWAALPDSEDRALTLAAVVLGVLAGQLFVYTTFLSPVILVLMGLLQRSSMVSQLQVAATTDAKTGLLNAAAWQELAQRELLRAKRDQVPGAVMLLDLDHFKRLNDTLGHLRGDVALRAVADALRRELRGYDAVARFGGEEFVVFLNDLPIGDATVVAERVLTRIRNLAIPSSEAGGERYQLTASIGLSSFPEHGDTVIELLEQADLALYGAKNSGRDRVGLPRGSHELPARTGAMRAADERANDGRTGESRTSSDRAADDFRPPRAREAS